jgi:hypothetical protein
MAFLALVPTAVLVGLWLRGRYPPPWVRRRP